MLYGTGADWVPRAACRGMDSDLFYPAQGESLAQPRSVCRGCVVRMECLEHALETPEIYGVWGGLSERERRRLRRHRKVVMERNTGIMAS